MKRIHNTKDENLTLYPCCYIQRGLRPTGIWYSVDHSWHEFLGDKTQGLLMLHNYDLDVDQERLYVIKNFTDLCIFMEKYWHVISDYGAGMVEHSPEWRKVAMGYGGFEVQNYGYIKDAYDRHRYKHRDKLLPGWIWFFALDADCGCIWDVSIIHSVKKIAQPKA